MITALRNYALIAICAFSTYLGAHATYTTDNTALFFNLYDVVLKPKQKIPVRNALQKIYGPLRTAFQNVDRSNCANVTDYALKLESHNYAKEARFVRQWLAAYQINQDICTIIQNIGAKGYDVGVLSNGNEYTDDDLINNDPFAPINILSAELMLYDSESYDNHDNENNEAPPINIVFESITFLATIFSFFIDDLHMIYVDSERAHTLLAAEYGIEGIRFTSAKQLEKDLKTIGIL